MLNEHREKFKQLSIKIGIIFSKTGLSPNQWTALSILPAIIAAVLIVQHQFILGAFFLGIAAFLDFVDGSVARVTGRVTKFGAYFDTIVDRYIELAIITSLFFLELPQVLLPHRLWLLFYLFGSMMTTYAKAAAKEKDLVKTELKGGIMERAERMILLFMGILGAAYNPIILPAILAVLAIGTNITALQRIIKAKNAKE